MSAADSGIRFIPLAVPEVFAILLTGAVIKVTGHYVSNMFPGHISHFVGIITDVLRGQVPFMILGALVGATGTSLLTTIGLRTSTVQWAAYLVLTGLGIGFGINIPYTALQVALKYLPALQNIRLVLTVSK